MTVVDLLSRSEMLKDLGPEALQSIAEIVVEKQVEEGDSIYDLGDDALDLFLLTEGRIRFTLGVNNRPGSKGSIIEAISVFGWAALLEDQPRRVATAVCLEDSKVLVIPGAEMLRVFKADPESGYSVMRRLVTMITRDYLSDISA